MQPRQSQASTRCPTCNNEETHSICPILRRAKVSSLREMGYPDNRIFYIYCHIEEGRLIEFSLCGSKNRTGPQLLIPLDVLGADETDEFEADFKADEKSLRKGFDEELIDAAKRTLNLERRVKRYLESCYDSDLQIRLSGGMLHYHNMRNAASVLLGPKSVLEDRVARWPGPSADDRAEHLIVLELGRQSESESHATAAVSALPNSNTQSKAVFGKHTKHLLKRVGALIRYCPRNERSTWAMLASATRKSDSCYEVDVGGGRRHLGETPFQCAIRKTASELNLSIDGGWKYRGHFHLDRNPCDISSLQYFVWTAKR